MHSGTKSIWFLFQNFTVSSSCAFLFNLPLIFHCQHSLVLVGSQSETKANVKVIQPQISDFLHHK